MRVIVIKKIEIYGKRIPMQCNREKAVQMKPVTLKYPIINYPNNVRRQRLFKIFETYILCHQKEEATAI